MLHVLLVLCVMLTLMVQQEVHVRKRSQQLRLADLPQAQRVPHVSSHQEMEMGALVAGLQQPLNPSSGNQADPVAALQELNSLRSLQGAPLIGAADRMRMQNLQVPPFPPLCPSPSWALHCEIWKYCQSTS